MDKPTPDHSVNGTHIMAGQDFRTAPLAERLSVLNTDLCNQIYDVQAVVNLAEWEAWNGTMELGACGRDAMEQFSVISRALKVASKLLGVVVEQIDCEVKVKPAEVANG